MGEETFVCPACGGELEAERIYNEAHHFAIDPATGTIGRAPSEILEGLYEDRYRIACTGCPWNDEDEESPFGHEWNIDGTNRLTPPQEAPNNV